MDQTLTWYRMEGTNSIWVNEEGWKCLQKSAQWDGKKEIGGKGVPGWLIGSDAAAE